MASCQPTKKVVVGYSRAPLHLTCNGIVRNILKLTIFYSVALFLYLFRFVFSSINDSFFVIHFLNKPKKKKLHNLNP